MIVRSIRKLFRRATNVLYRPYVLRRIRRKGKIVFHGCEIETHPAVFHPVFFSSTELLIRSLEKISVSGKSFLDMGTGTGAVGIIVARRGATVVACDVNETAVALARRNASRNSVTIDVRWSDLFSHLNGEMFDIIAFNIPFYPKTRRNDFEKAFNAGESFVVVKQFAREAARHLDTHGIVVIVFSEDSGYTQITDIFLAEGFRIFSSIVSLKMFEKFYVVSLVR